MRSVLAFLILSSLGTASAAPAVFRIDPSATRITFSLDATAHTVEGSFAVRSGSVTLEQEDGSLTGEVVVDVTSGKTGNDRRDKKMHEEVLESIEYPTAVFRPQRMTGKIPSHGSTEVKIEGILTLHGSDHALTLPAQVTADGDRLSVVAEFGVPYVEWGLEDPSVFVLRVAKQVAVRVELTGALSASPRSSKP